MLLKRKSSRALFLLGIIVSFIVIHFTDLLTYGGLDFEDLVEQSTRKPFLPFVYLAMLTIPSLAVAIIIPWLTKWVKAGE